MTEKEVIEFVQAQLKGADVRVRDMTGGGDHYEIRVVSEQFEGLNLVARHRLLHKVLEGPMAGDIHAVKFKTLTPAEDLARG